ncbi:hypothetical protein L249_3951 [Ophiocordyceps polyrhachis-furcata BCC 54312]|uniref:Aldehyde dehydrogenase domain-containing protein n=1 Tax=Ophiocordyceps polyrhachis-furcata BCC 54312 TaxID=1330021 RepID=A0A367L5L6_9HYPO|nr:hypothetical protein L249_3951 [Ophiocordyceps polyrhachis-furcata BCC 54312]
MVMAERSFQGKVSIVTGGASGFGKAIAEKLCLQGGKVVIADVAEEYGISVAKQLDCVFVKADVTSRSDWERILSKTIEAYGQVDVIVNNAGWAYLAKPSEQVSEADFDMVFNVNVKSVFMSTAVLMPYLIKEGRKACFVQVASTGGVRPRPRLTWYNATKGAVITITKSLAAEYASHGIRFNAVSPAVSGSTRLRGRRTDHATMSPPFKLNDSSLLRFDCHVDGNWVAAQSGQRFTLIDPGSGSSWGECAVAGEAEVDAAVQAAQRAFGEYRSWTPRQRAEALLRWHGLLQAARDDLATMLVHETGKPLKEAHGEIDYALPFVSWAAGETERVHGRWQTPSSGPGRRAMTIKQPMGVAVALVPWNFPIVLCLRKMSTALAAGCSLVLKPSPETPVTALAAAKLVIEAGFPPGLVNVLPTSLEGTPIVAEALCRHPLVRIVSFTGSTRVGRIIARFCGEELKRSTLELGGNCPFIVFDDADVDRTVEQLMGLKWRHAGQVCISANRVYVQRGVHDRLVQELVARASKLSVGHGMKEGVTMGSLTTDRGLDKAEELAKDAREKGARFVLGSGERVSGGGYFMKPTIVTGLTPDMGMSREEIFAPMLGVAIFDDEDEVVKLANDTSMGLASYVFTQDVDRLFRMFEKLEAGVVGLNTGNSSSTEIPFGGIKASGWGKEGGMDLGLDEYMWTKSGTLSVKSHW